MSESPSRSPLLMSRDDTGLLVIDVQGKLVTLIPEHAQIIWNIRRLIDGADALGVSNALSRQSSGCQRRRSTVPPGTPGLSPTASIAFRPSSRRWFMYCDQANCSKNSVARAGQPVTSRASCSNIAAVPLRRR